MLSNRSPRVAIIGAGFGGIAAAIELRRHGIEDVVLLEAGPGVGGTWLHNTYPGAACDVPSHLYSYSFAQRRDWERLCPTQPAILGYIRSVTTEHGVEGLVRTAIRVDSCSWDERAGLWTLTTSNGDRLEADSVIVATGQLHRPAYPRIDGLSEFEGHSFHSAEWDHGYDLRGKRVAVIGTGASAVQFVPPLAEECAHLTVFQRTANWFMPRQNRRYPKPVAFAIRRVPGLQAFRRKFIFWYGECLTLMIRHPRSVGRIGKLRSTLFMRSQVKDPELRRKLTPDYTFGCKRVLFSSFFLPVFERPDVDLVTDPIERVTATGIVTGDGVEREMDCIIFGTGFKTNDFMFPMRITGRDGLQLEDAWRDGPHAHLGMTVPGFPSLFLMYGPNTNTSGGSILVYLEAQASYIRQAVESVRARGSAAIEVRPEIEAASDREVQDSFRGTAWVRCDSWYRDDTGRIVANWPGYMHQYVSRTERFDPTEYLFLGN
ncbi:MAG: NAD(P)/FAD-dependent oxidoreductase [Actinomycetes bacterium]